MHRVVYPTCRRIYSLAQIQSSFSASETCRSSLHNFGINTIHGTGYINKDASIGFGTFPWDGATKGERQDAPHIPRDVQDAQRDLDEFFGTANDPLLETTPKYFERESSHDAAEVLGEASSHMEAPNTVQEAIWPRLSKSTAPESSLPGSSDHLTHTDASGKAAMVDVGQKASTQRKARASAWIYLGEKAFTLVASNNVAKGDVLTTAQLAGIMGAKHTSLLIPLCHNIFLSKADVKLHLKPEKSAIYVEATVSTVGMTGVEMEALTAASVASLTVYDMCKAVSKDIVISDVRLDHKSGGKSGDYSRPNVTEEP